jgi:hypothetical protein
VKIIKIKFFLIGFFVLGLVSLSYVSFAETQIEVQDGEISVSTSPSSPQPYQDITISINSYATDLNKAIISWQDDSGTVLYGIGKTSYSFKTGGPDITTVINISIKPSGSLNTINKKVAITPSEIEIMWESVDGYTPPFYKGKSFPVSGGLIKAVAIPNTNTIKSGIGSLTYTWKNNESVALDSSGYNKNSYIFKNNMFDGTSNITVNASSVNENYSAEKTIQIPIYKPKIVFYKKSPTEGVLYNNALNKEAEVTEDEITIIAEPYFLSLKGNENNFNYNWQINGENIQTPSKKMELTVRPASRGGYATISLVIENLNELFQKASNQLKLIL